MHIRVYLLTKHTTLNMESFVICFGLILLFINEAESGSYCYTYDSYYEPQTRYCSSGCCDDGCCSSAAVLWGVLGSIGAITVVAVVIAIYCCRRRRAMTGGVVSTAQPWPGNQVTVVSQGYGGGYIINNQQMAPAPGVQYPPAPYPQTAQAVQGYPQTSQGYGYPNTDIGPMPPSYNEAVTTPVVHSSGQAHQDKQGLPQATPSAPTF